MCLAQNNTFVLRLIQSVQDSLYNIIQECIQQDDEIVETWLDFKPTKTSDSLPYRRGDMGCQLWVPMRKITICREYTVSINPDLAFKFPS